MLAGHWMYTVDGADEINSALERIKGGGAALTREKIIAGASEHFICTADQSKRVSELGAFPPSGRGDSDGVESWGAPVSRLGRYADLARGRHY